MHFVAGNQERQIEKTSLYVEVESKRQFHLLWIQVYVATICLNAKWSAFWAGAFQV